jgi:hypothetical protein
VTLEAAVWVRGYRLLFAALTLFAILFQLNRSMDRLNFPASNFFSLFTIESNIFAAAVLYMATTGVVCGLLLAGYQEELQTTPPWVDTVVHRVMPLVMVIDWLLVPPANRLTMRRALVWLLYPLAYCAYSLIRGPIVGWYP